MFRNACLIFLALSCISPLANAADDGPRLKPPASGEIPVAFVITEGANVIDFAGLFSGTALAPPRSFALRLQAEF